MLSIIKSSLNYVFVVTLVTSAVISVPCRADDVSAETLSSDQTTLPTVVVSATRIPTPAAEVASSITVITAKEIEEKQRRTLPDVLADVPGMNVVQTGSPGGVTSVFTRGTNANHTKVFIDGIDVSDPSTPNNSFDYSQILASDIERVEVLRGPQSGLYGSDAIGGVINIITKKGSGPLQFTATAEGGSFTTFNQTAGVRGSQDGFNYAVHFAHHHTGDVQVTPTDLVPPNRRLNDDYYDNINFSTKLGYNFTDNFDVGVVARVVNSKLKYTSDDFIGPQNERNVGDNLNYFMRGTAQLALLEGRFHQTLGLSYAHYDRSNEDPNRGSFSPYSEYAGGRMKLDWIGDFKVIQGQTLTFGLEHQNEKIDQIDGAESSNNAAFIQLQSALWDRFFNTVSLRHDEHERFGGKTTFRVAPAVLFTETDTKVKASVGTGFKAPTLDQLYHDYPSFGFLGNRNLLPEESLGYDVGFEQGLWDHKVQFGTTYFHNDIENLIAANRNFTTNINVGEATTEGFETFITLKPLDMLTIRGDHTYTLANNDVTDTQLLRRPKHKASLNVAVQALDDLLLTSTVAYHGAWLDINRSGSIPDLHRGAYTLVNFTAAYNIGYGLEAFGRVDNVLDREYENPTGFQRPDLGVYAGLKFSLDTGERQ